MLTHRNAFTLGAVMRPFLASVVALFTLLSLGFIAIPNAEPTEKRIALVIGNAAYRTRPLPTSANDAGLIAQTLQAAGFDVVGARDLDQESLRRALREFLDKASSAGPDTVAFIYLSGYGLQLEGENYFVPVDANIRGSADVPAEDLRLSDYLRPLGSLKLKGSMVVLDAARASPFSMPGEALAGGLALVEPSPGMLIAFNAAPGTIAPERDGPYGAYAQALAEMMREGGLAAARAVRARAAARKRHDQGRPGPLERIEDGNLIPVLRAFRGRACGSVRRADHRVAAVARARRFGCLPRCGRARHHRRL